MIKFFHGSLIRTETLIKQSRPSVENHKGCFLKDCIVAKTNNIDLSKYLKKEFKLIFTVF